MSNHLFHKCIITLIMLVPISTIASEQKKQLVHIMPSFAGISVGMSIEQIKQQKPGIYEQKYGDEEPECYFVYLNKSDDQPYGFMMIDDQVKRIDVFREHGNAILPSGLGIGSSKKEVLEKYPNLKASMHEYMGPIGEYLTIDLGNNLGLIFETYKDKVTSYRIGWFPYVGFIEGCA